MKKQKFILKYILVLLATAALVYFAFKQIKINDVIDAMKRANYIYILLSLIPAMLAFASRAIRWNLLLHPLGYRPKFRNSFYALMFGYLANLAFPRLGEVSRSVALNRAENIPLDKIIGTVIAERAVDVVSLLVCIVLTLVMEFERIYSFMTMYLFDPLINKMSSAMQSGLFYPVIAVLILAIIAAVIIMRRRQQAASLTDKIILFFKGILTGLASVMKMKNPAAFIFHSVFIWTMYWLITYICFFSLDATASLGLKAALFILVAGGLGMTAPIPGGIGAYHYLVGQGLIIYGIVETEGVAYATIVHASQMLVILLVGTFSFWRLSVNKKQLSANVNA